MGSLLLAEDCRAALLFHLSIGTTLPYLGSREDLERLCCCDDMQNVSVKYRCRYPSHRQPRMS